MALDVDRLRAGLSDYQGRLAQQRERLAAEYQELQGSFEALWAVYGGQRAEEFRQHWRSTAQWFEEYLETSRRLDVFLEARLEQLRQV